MVEKMRNVAPQAPTKNITLWRCILFFVLTVMSLAAWAQGENLRSIVDRTEIGIDETLQLTVRYTGPSRQAQQPTFTHLNSQFDILSTTQSNQFRAINGQVNSYTDWVMVLAPKREGRLIIPSFRLGSLISDAVEITVTPAKQSPNGGVTDIYLETEIDKSSVYVQEQVRVTYRLFFAQNVNSLDNPDPSIDKVIVDKLPDARYDRRIGGRHYGVAEFSYALFPQESGEIVIPALRWTLTIPRSGQNRSFFGLSGRVETRRLRTEEKTIEVKPRPDNFPNNHTWLPAQNLTLEESWSTDPATLNVGEPVTRTITLKAKGLLASQLPPVWSGMNDQNIKTYADQPELNEERSSDGLQAIRIESAAVVVNIAGELTLPPIKLPWWDTSTNTLQYAALPERKLKAKSSGAQARAPQLGANASNVPTPTSTQPGAPLPADASAQVSTLQAKLWFWRYLSLALALVVLVTTAVIYRLLKRPLVAPARGISQANEGPRDEAKAFKSLRLQCQQGDPQKIRAALLAWAKHHWQPAPTTLEAISEQLNDAAIAHQLSLLDTALFGQGSDEAFDGNQLAALLKDHREREKTKAPDTSLATFYPGQG